ncbi:hypothetical protein [Varibaculum cambriense]|uniref:hypothetical protein n=1 Tax=Varibaculum cambriense TaxID=184870 RepID=UPI0028050626|nr:hypothetical protein [Varibaculum cambriense]MDU7408575.1 hypothetical protein [Varibaculum cambriense]
MSEADFPSRPLEQTYSPISKYGQISIAEQLARLEEIRTGGRRPAYRPQPPSQESQWGQIQEGFSQVEGDISWQLRQESSAAEQKRQRQLSPEQDGRSWVQEYREKQQMRKVAQEARERAEADLQRILKEREEAQAYAREQERLAAEAAERLRKLEDAEQEALRTAAREQQRREQRVLNTQVAEEKSEAEKMAELLASFQNLQAGSAQPPASAPAAPADATLRVTEAMSQEAQPVPQVPLQSPPRDSLAESHPRAVSQEPAAPLTPTPQPESPRQAPAGAARTQVGVAAAPVDLGERQPQAPSRIFADTPGGTGKPVYSPANADAGLSGPTPGVGTALDADTTQPVKVSPIDALADEADDRALADSLAFAATNKHHAATSLAPVPAPKTPAPWPGNVAPAPAPANSLARGQAGAVRPQVASPVAPAPQVQSAPAGATNAQTAPRTSAQLSASGAANLPPLNLAVGEAGSAAEMFQQALAQSNLGATRAAPAASQTPGPAGNTASQVSVRPAPAPPSTTSGQRQVSGLAAAAQVEPQVSQVSAAPASGVQPASPAPAIPAQGNVVAPPPAPAPGTLPGSPATQPAYAPSAAPALPDSAPAPTSATATAASPTAASAAVVSPTAAPVTDSSEAKPSDAPFASAESEPPQEAKTRWWQWKRKVKKAEAPEQEDTRAGAWQESADEESEEEPLTFIQTFLRWVLRLSILLIIALGMVLTMDRPVISQTMGQDILQAGIVDDVTVTQI